MTLRINERRPAEDLPVEEKMLMREARDGDLWYVYFAPEPLGVRQRIVAWFVEHLTPEWNLVRGSRTVDTPYDASLAGIAMAAEIEEKKKGPVRPIHYRKVDRDQLQFHFDEEGE